MLAGGGRDDVVARLADRLGRRVLLIAADGAVRVDSATGERSLTGARELVLEPLTVERVAATGPIDVTTLDGLAARAVPVTAAPGRRWALLAERGSTPLADELLVAAASALRLDAVRRDARADAVAESASWLIDELRFGSARPTDEMTRLALRLGVRTDAPHAAAALRYLGPDTEMWATATAWIDAPVQVVGELAWTVLSGDVTARAVHVCTRLSQFARGDVLIGVGPAVVGAHATRTSFGEADRVLAVMRHRHQAGVKVGSVASAGDLGPAGLLLHSPRPALEAFVAAELGPVLDRPELLQTLAAWCETGGRRQETARAVTVHRNSLTYRLARIGELLDADLHEPDVQFRLRTALTAVELLAALPAT